MRLIFAVREGCSCMQRNPFYYIFAADSRYKITGRHLECLGSFDPVPGTQLLLRMLAVEGAGGLILECYGFDNHALCSVTLKDTKWIETARLQGILHVWSAEL